MIALVLALVGSAAASDWSDPKPYLQPRLSVGYVSVNGQGSAQGIGGADIGVRLRDRDAPHLLSISRVSAVGMYGFTSGSYGADFRLGSFIGPDGKAVRLMTGPDLFYSGYGQPGAPDFFLPWSPGLDIQNTALFKIAKEFKIAAHVVPGWAFASERAAPNVPVFTHVRMGAVALINAGSFRISVGAERVANVAGTQDYIILGAGI